MQSSQSHLKSLTGLQREMLRKFNKEVNDPLLLKLDLLDDEKWQEWWDIQIKWLTTLVANNPKEDIPPEDQQLLWAVSQSLGKAIDRSRFYVCPFLKSDLKSLCEAIAAKEYTAGVQPSSNLKSLPDICRDKLREFNGKINIDRSLKQDLLDDEKWEKWWDDEITRLIRFVKENENSEIDGEDQQLLLTASEALNDLLIRSGPLSHITLKWHVRNLREAMAEKKYMSAPPSSSSQVPLPTAATASSSASTELVGDGSRREVASSAASNVFVTIDNLPPPIPYDPTHVGPGSAAAAAAQPAAEAARAAQQEQPPAAVEPTAEPASNRSSDPLMSQPSAEAAMAAEQVVQPPAAVERTAKPVSSRSSYPLMSQPSAKLGPLAPVIQNMSAQPKEKRKEGIFSLAIWANLEEVLRKHFETLEQRRKSLNSLREGLIKYLKVMPLNKKLVNQVGTYWRSNDDDDISVPPGSLDITQRVAIRFFKILQNEKHYEWYWFLDKIWLSDFEKLLDFVNKNEIDFQSPQGKFLLTLAHSVDSKLSDSDLARPQSNAGLCIDQALIKGINQELTGFLLEPFRTLFNKRVIPALEKIGMFSEAVKRQHRKYARRFQAVSPPLVVEDLSSGAAFAYPSSSKAVLSPVEQAKAAAGAGATAQESPAPQTTDSLASPQEPIVRIIAEEPSGEVNGAEAEAQELPASQASRSLAFPNESKDRINELLQKIKNINLSWKTTIFGLFVYSVLLASPFYLIKGFELWAKNLWVQYPWQSVLLGVTLLVVFSILGALFKWAIKRPIISEVEATEKAITEDGIPVRPLISAHGYYGRLQTLFDDHPYSSSFLSTGEVEKELKEFFRSDRTEYPENPGHSVEPV